VELFNKDANQKCYGLFASGRKTQTRIRSKNLHTLIFSSTAVLIRVYDDNVFYDDNTCLSYFVCYI